MSDLVVEILILFFEVLCSKIFLPVRLDFITIPQN